MLWLSYGTLPAHFALLVRLGDGLAQSECRFYISLAGKRG
jgi:hypothetical protein